MLGESGKVILAVTTVFEKLGIAYAVGGSISSSLHGVMRSTIDIDIIADMHPEHIEQFVAALSRDFYADDEMIRGAIEQRSSFNLIHYDTAYKVDVFIPKQRKFDLSQLERRENAPISNDPERSVYLTSPEDVILSKLEWYRMGGEISDRQWLDVLGVLKTKSGQLDIEYLRRMAAELKVLDLLERALIDA